MADQYYGATGRRMLSDPYSGINASVAYLPTEAALSAQHDYEAKVLQAQRDQLAQDAAISAEELAYAKDQANKSTGVGVMDALAGGYLGYKGVKENKELLADLRNRLTGKGGASTTSTGGASTASNVPPAANLSDLPSAESLINTTPAKDAIYTTPGQVELSGGPNMSVNLPFSTHQTTLPSASSLINTTPAADAIYTTPAQVELSGGPHMSVNMPSSVGSGAAAGGTGAATGLGFAPGGATAAGGSAGAAGSLGSAPAGGLSLGALGPIAMFAGARYAHAQDKTQNVPTSAQEQANKEGRVIGSDYRGVASLDTWYGKMLNKAYWGNLNKAEGSHGTHYTAKTLAPDRSKWETNLSQPKLPKVSSARQALGGGFK